MEGGQQRFRRPLFLVFFRDKGLVGRHASTNPCHLTGHGLVDAQDVVGQPGGQEFQYGLAFVHHMGREPAAQALDLFQVVTMLSLVFLQETGVQALLFHEPLLLSEVVDGVFLKLPVEAHEVHGGGITVVADAIADGVDDIHQVAVLEVHIRQAGGKALGPQKGL